MLNLREHLTRAAPTRAIFTSFPLSPTLLESQVIRPLLDSGCEEILLLVDRIGYEALLTERSALAHAGCTYWVGAVDALPYVFNRRSRCSGLLPDFSNISG